jgi:hypothetical protein
MQDHLDNAVEDWVTVARLVDPIGASVLRGCLEAAGIPAVISDANIVQTNALLTNAVGGVRVQVPAHYVESAKHAIEEYERGAYRLEDEDEKPSVASPRPTDLRLWGPDTAAILSLLLTPLFAAVIHFANSRVLKDARLFRVASVWLVIGFVVTGFTMYLVLSARWDMAIPFFIGAILSLYTLIWYFVAGYSQSKYIASSFGAKYRHRSLMMPALAALALLFAIGYAGSFFQ